ncbi:hypothetical protein EXIGLDRAFT_720685 [Exidia glandulosa HHB12029]|uniref:AA1-like domain-containing protein n=1 Tax=Exidia glandulosa HHB12029 TaxID=1314781 RepID=A0A165G7W9_EXIGL|nr:hypothetical protein EXIGLDRAFT_720685 [Exidia glandulosa HHB12029]
MRRAIASLSFFLLPAVLAVTIPIHRVVTREGCKILPLEITNFKLVEDSTNFYDVGFNFTFSTQEGRVQDGSCYLGAPKASGIFDTRGECNPKGLAFFRYQESGELSVGFDFLCSGDVGLPQVIPFNGTMPLKCDPTAGGQNCSQDGAVALNAAV